MSTDSKPPWPPWLALLKISRVTFWFIWVTPVIYGYIASSDRASSRHLGWFVLAAVGTCFLEAITCIHNELVDQEADRINQPRRSLLLQSLDQKRLWRVVAAGYLVCLAGIITIGAVVGTDIALLMILGGVAAPLYNWGPHLKHRLGLAEVAIGWAGFFGYYSGWMWNRPEAPLPAVSWVVAYFFAVLSLMKDLPDVEGDERVGARNLFTLHGRRLRHLATRFIYFSPYVLVLLLVTFDVLPPKFLALFVLAPMALTSMWLGDRGFSVETRLLAFEAAHLYMHVFFLVAFVIDRPTAVAVVFAVVLFGARCAALRWGLGARHVEVDFSWTQSLRALVRASPLVTHGGHP